MPARSRRGSISLALVGTGGEWEHRVKPAVEEFRDRLKIVAVYDEVRSRALSVASEFKAEAATSLTALAERPDIDGFLVCHLGWMNDATIELLTLHGKPCLICEWDQLSDADLERLTTLADDVGSTLMVDFKIRFEPVHRRLRELSATELGPLQHLEVFFPATAEAPPGSLVENVVSHSDGETYSLMNAGERELIEWLDVSQVLLGRTPQSLTLHSAGQSLARLSENEISLKVEDSKNWHWLAAWNQPGAGISAVYRQLPSGAVAKLVSEVVKPTPGTTMNFSRSQAVSSPVAPVVPPHIPEVTAKLTFAKGVSFVTSTTQFTWSRPNEPNHDEDLSSERPTHVLMLDQFVRRSVGGLLPVPELSHVLRYRKLLKQLSQP